jgi:hypothetical protein
MRDSADFVKLARYLLAADLDHDPAVASSRGQGAVIRRNA